MAIVFTAVICITRALTTPPTFASVVGDVERLPVNTDGGKGTVLIQRVKWSIPIMQGVLGHMLLHREGRGGAR